MGAEAGSIFWAEAQGRCHAAFVFAADRPLGRAGLSLGSGLLDLGALALFDALAVLAPPQIPMHLLPPDGLAVDGGRVATLCLARAPSVGGEVPNGDVSDLRAPKWAILGIEVAIDLQSDAPGETPDRTCLAAEGFGDVTAGDLLAHLCRHMLCWVDAWRDDGSGALAQAVSLRTLGAKAVA